jgi:hypothetical protein
MRSAPPCFPEMDIIRMISPQRRDLHVERLALPRLTVTRRLRFTFYAASLCRRRMSPSKRGIATLYSQ